jgi:NAD(P)-dependent dehydrogenase (short-subunit alcohol dehydrogenase family)
MGTEARRGISGKTLLLGGALGAVLLGRKLLKGRREADLSGQVALVTGGTRGLGYLVAREFGREGCRLAICARDPEELRQAQQDLAGQGFDVLALQCDVSQPQEVQEMIDIATGHFGKIDILVNNAGIIQFGPLRSMTRKDFEDAMGNMFWGTVNPTLSVLPQMTERKSGRIVNITSVGGKVSVPHLVPYNSAKFAQLGFSEGIHAELKQDGIQVTTIVPGLMRTGSYFNAQFKGETDKEYAWFSLGSSLPLITIDAERAARQIVQATKRGEAERILSIPANIIARLNGVAPATTANILGLVDKYILPDADGVQMDAVPGHRVQDRLDSETHKAATTLGREAAQEFQPEQNLPEDMESAERS